MALKTTNYTVAETGVILSEAIALVTNIDTINNKATLSIATNRENAEKGIVVKKVDIKCEFDRNGNLMEQAYISATKPSTLKVNGNKVTVSSLPYFSGWENEIL